jgi:hypothetical protein
MNYIAPGQFFNTFNNLILSNCGILGKKKEGVIIAPSKKIFKISMDLVFSFHPLTNTWLEVLTLE